MAKKARATTKPANETKAGKFSRLATMRVKKAIKALTTIGGLSGSTYEYTEDQVEKIDSLITTTWAGVLERFNKNGSTKSDDSFTI